MIDLHNHILPGVDDGAADSDESLQIAREFVSEGVTRIAATPHLDPDNRRGIHGPEIRRRVERLHAAIVDAGVPLEIEPGQELYLTPEAPDLLRANTAIGLGRGTAVLLELSLISATRPLYLEDTLFRLQLEGMQPVLAHPDRYRFVQRDPSSLDDVINAGTLMQLTAPSLAGQYGPAVRRLAERLLKRGAYALAASDRHHPGADRSLVQLYERIQQLTDTDTSDLLLRTNPARVLDGEEIERPDLVGWTQGSFLGRMLRRS